MVIVIQQSIENAYHKNLKNAFQITKKKEDKIYLKLLFIHDVKKTNSIVNRVNQKIARLKICTVY